MDKANLRAGLLDAIRTHLPNFERSARVTCLLSIRIDGSDESAVFLDIVEDLAPAASDAMATAAASAAAAAAESAALSALNSSKAEKSSKRKSQAPQKMVANGLDSFVAAGSGIATPIATSAATPTTANSSASLTAAAPAVSSASTVKKEAGSGGGGCVGFYVNNPSFQQHFLLPTGFLTTSVFPTPTAVFQSSRPQFPPPLQQQQQQQQQPPPLNRPDNFNIIGSKDTHSGGSGSQQQPNELKPAGQRSRSLFGLRSRRGGHRSFPCNQCQEAFASLANLSKHTYSMHKSYKCTFCSASFTQRSNLQRHSLKHVGFKPFACRCCQKSYYRKDHLVRHIEVTHPGNEPKRNIETKLTSSECLEFLERRYESGEYSIAIDGEGEGEGEGEADAEVDEEMADEEELDEAEAVPEAGAAADADTAMSVAADPAAEQVEFVKADAGADPEVDGATTADAAEDAETKQEASAPSECHSAGEAEPQAQQEQHQQRWLRHHKPPDSASTGSVAAEAASA